MNIAKFFAATRLLWIRTGGAGDTQTVKRNDHAALSRNGFDSRKRTLDQLLTVHGCRRIGDWQELRRGVYQCDIERIARCGRRHSSLDRDWNIASTH